MSKVPESKSAGEQSGSFFRSCVVPPSEAAQLSAVPALLMPWFDAHARELPWRSDPTPYHVWISEIMLQQTRVEAVKPYYARFISRLPDVRALAECPEDELLKLWEGLGYYSRARNLQKAARICCDQYGGTLPSDYEKLLKLQGIGDYTAGAVASIAFGIPVPAVDGNVLRVVSRITALREDIRQEAVKQQVRDQIHKIIPSDAPGKFNQALMELGACICVPNGKPCCEECPVRPVCLACAHGLTDILPVRSAPRERRVEQRTVIVVRDGLRTVLFQRPKRGLLAGMYEFPCLSGHRSETEVLQTVKGWGLLPVRIEPMGSAKHIFTHIEWQMTGYMVLVEQLPDGEDYTASGTKQFQEERKRLVERTDSEFRETMPTFPLDTLPRIAGINEIRTQLAIPAAYGFYVRQLNLEDNLEDEGDPTT